ncbi:MAG: peptidase C39 family protein [Proteobacteria bacterium]|nr:peptidase C39 family protein [Pseudomonadota bacterium]
MRPKAVTLPRAEAPRRAAPEPSIRAARVADIPALLRLEELCFASDRLSRRSFQHLLTKGHAISLVAELGEEVIGYAIVLLHGRTSLARLYSIAVEPTRQGRGYGLALVREAEARVLADGRAVMRLEVRPDNPRAIARYRESGYREIGVYPNFYEDHADALRMEKMLAGGDRPELRRIPYYAQTLEFTCGAACLMMAMKTLDPGLGLGRNLELKLWRESTLIFMSAGHGGASPYGLALAARRRGFEVEVFVNDDGPLFLDSVRSSEKKEVMRLVHEDFRAEAAEAGIPVVHRALTADELMGYLSAEAVPVVLFSSYALYGEKEPHWVVLTGHDERFIYFHDPFVGTEGHKTPIDCMNVPVSHPDFDRMARYGSAGLRAAVILKRRRETGRRGH